MEAPTCTGVMKPLFTIPLLFSDQRASLSIEWFSNRMESLSEDSSVCWGCPGLCRHRSASVLIRQKTQFSSHLSKWGVKLFLLHPLLLPKPVLAVLSWNMSPSPPWHLAGCWGIVTTSLKDKGSCCWLGRLSQRAGSHRGFIPLCVLPINKALTTLPLNLLARWLAGR